MPDPATTSRRAFLGQLERLNALLLGQAKSDSPSTRGRHLLIITALLLAIGLADYLTGVRVSLALFYVVPVALGSAWLGWQAGCLSGLASVILRVGGDIAAGGYNAGALTVFWNRLIDFLMYCVVALILHALVTLQRQLEQRVRERTADLARALRDREDLQRQLFSISRRERASIGHELHDGLGQHLTATSLAAKLLSDRLQAESHPAAAESGQLLRLLQEGIAQTRQIARGLLLSSIEPDELAGEIEELAAALQRDHGVECRFSCTGSLDGLDVAQASHLYYIAQEAARNALRHAHPTRLEIRLQGSVESLELRVSDNGTGLPATAGNGGMGLRIMAHRAELIGASFRLESVPGRGLSVSCQLPKIPPPSSPEP